MAGHDNLTDKQRRNRSSEWSPVSLDNTQTDAGASGSMSIPFSNPPKIYPPSYISSEHSSVSPAVSGMGGSGGIPQIPSSSGSISQSINLADGTSLVMRMGNLEETEISQRYDVGEQVGRGASAVVYEAWRKTDRFHVVIKVLTVGSLDDEEAHTAIKRFYREAELITKLKEEHIVQCVDYGRFHGTPCMVLEFVDGLSLDKFLAQYGAIPLAYATGIIEQLLLALVETHSQGIIHRDIKPGNMMVFDSPPPYTIRVLDFGISSVLDGFQSKTLMTQAGNVRGTPSYMAPELFTGETRASIESDLYAVGLVYLECLTGEVAVNDKSFMRVAYKQVNEPIEVPGYVPSGIADIIIKLCAKPVAERYHSASVVLDDIRAALPVALEEEENCFKEWKNSNQTLFRRGSVVSSIASLQNDAAYVPVYKQPIFLIAGAGILALIVVLMIVLFNLKENSQELVHSQDNVTEVVTPEDQKKQIQQTIEQASSFVDAIWGFGVQGVKAEIVTDLSTKAKQEADAITEEVKKRQQASKQGNNGKKKKRKVDIGAIHVKDHQSGNAGKK